MLKLFSKILMILLCVATTSSISLSQSSEETPSLYYYSETDSAFIIENANGENREVLATFELPPEHIFVDGPGWSMTSQWFAWTSRRARITGNEQNVYVTDGTSTYTIFPNDTIQVDEILWSPTRDLLLIMYYEMSDSLVQNIMVFNPSNNSISFDLNAEEFTSSTSRLLQASWSPNGEYVVLNSGDTLEILSVDGNEHTTIETQTTGYTGCSDFGTLPHWIDSDSLAYIASQNGDLIVERPFSDELVASISLPENEVAFVDWSGDGETALVYTEANASYQIWLLSVLNASIRLISEDVYFTSNCDHPFTSSLWGFSDNAVFLSSENRLFSVTSAEDMYEVNLPPELYVNSTTPMHWANENDLIFVAHTDDSTGDKVYKYSLSSNNVTLLYPQTPDVVLLIDFLSTVNNNKIVVENLLLDLSGGIQDEFLLENPQIIDIEWSSYSDWFLAITNTAPEDNNVYLINPISETSRTVATCPMDTLSCYGWILRDN